MISHILFCFNYISFNLLNRFNLDPMVFGLLAWSTFHWFLYQMQKNTQTTWFRNAQGQSYIIRWKRSWYSRWKVSFWISIDHQCCSIRLFINFSQSSVTRSYMQIVRLIKESGYKLIDERRQYKFPKGVYPVKMFCLKPIQEDKAIINNN